MFLEIHFEPAIPQYELKQLDDIVKIEREIHTKDAVYKYETIPNGSIIRILSQYVGDLWDSKSSDKVNKEIIGKHFYEFYLFYKKCVEKFSMKYRIW